MKTITIAMQKGGTGKTTTAQAIGTYLAEIKKQRVLFIDLDSQCNLSMTLQASETDGGALGVLMNPSAITDEIEQLTDNTAVLSATQDLENVNELVKGNRKAYQLSKALQSIERLYDYVIIDTPMVLNLAVINALTASDYVIIPCDCGMYSINGLSKLYEVIEEVQATSNPNLKALGIVLTRFSQRININKGIEQLAQRKAQELNTIVFNTKIRECSAIRECQAMQTSIYKYARHSNAAIDYGALTDEILAEITN